MGFTLAMDDALLKTLYDFKRGQLGETSTLVIQNLLRLYYPPHITSVKQLRAIGIDDPALLQSLAQQGLIEQTAAELAEYTRYKILLSVDNTQYPAIAISGDSVNSQFVMTLRCGEPRDKAHEWLKALLAGAVNVTIVDRFMFDGGKMRASTRNFFNLLPQKKLSLFFNSDPGVFASQIKQVFSNWKIKKNTDPLYSNVHDRYLLIDNKIEVVITSGIDYLFDTSKECTLLVREIR